MEPDASQKRLAKKFFVSMEPLVRPIHTPTVPEQFVLWHQLLSAVCGATPTTTEKDALSWRSLWNNYSWQFTHAKEYPSTFQTVKDELWERYLAVVYVYARPSWTNEIGAYAKKHLTIALAELYETNARAHYAVCRRHELEEFLGQPVAFRHTAEYFEVTTTQAREIYRVGLDILRTTLNRTTPRIERLVLPGSGDLGNWEGEAKRAQTELQNAVLVLGEKAALVRRVDELEWSVRTYNYLKNWSIEFVWILAMKNECELMRVRNFGKVSLAEVKYVLAGLGLSLGMQFDEKTIAYLETQTTKLNPITEE